MSIELEKPTLVYNGSVKRVWRPPGKEGSLWFEFTDDYSVFDWGKMPDTIANKGRALLAIGSACFEHLSRGDSFAALPASSRLEGFDRDWLARLFGTPLFGALRASGAPHHFLGLSSDDGQKVDLNSVADRSPLYMEVREAAVERPAAHQILGQTVFEYPRQKRARGRHRLVPLEVVFRFGMPQGSSLKARLERDPALFHKLGLRRPPAEGERFDRPVLEFYTKLEPKDRLLSLQEALLISGLPASGLEQLTELSFLIALALFDLCAARGIELWDGKFEFIEGDDGLLLADSIGPDELRLVCQGVSLSKEMVRHYYRGSAWERALPQAQSLAAQRGVLDWRSICADELGQTPGSLPGPFKGVVDRLYGVLANTLTGLPLFADHPALGDYVDEVKAALGQERAK